MANICSAKIALLLDFANAAQAFGVAAAELHDNIGTIPKDEYDRLYCSAEEHRAAAEAAHLALETHVQQHGC